MAEPIYKELVKHLQSKTVTKMENSHGIVAFSTRFFGINVTYDSEASRILRRDTRHLSD
jgi:hypothetical protein